jgi:hypothetical protein
MYLGTVTGSRAFQARGFQRSALMEILELIYALIQACGCFLEVAALGSSAGAGVAGYKAKQSEQARKQAEAKGEEPPPRNPYWIWFVALIFVAVFLVGLLFFKYVPRL